MTDVRLKQSITFADSSVILPVGVYTVGKTITKAQFAAIKDNTRFCEVLDGPKPKVKPAPIQAEAES